MVKLRTNTKLRYVSMRQKNGQYTTPYYFDMGKQLDIESIMYVQEDRVIEVRWKDGRYTVVPLYLCYHLEFAYLNEPSCDYRPVDVIVTSHGDTDTQDHRGHA